MDGKAITIQIINSAQCTDQEKVEFLAAKNKKIT